MNNNIKYVSSGNIKPKQQVLRDSTVTRSFAEWVIPMIAERQKQANNVVPAKFWQYNQVKTRLCSCFANQNDPDATCKACFGTGYLPGYVPVGYYTIVTLDISDPGLLLVNTEPDFTSGMNPKPIKLVDTALAGYVESSFIGISKNMGIPFVRHFASTFGVGYQYTVDNITWRDLIPDKLDPIIAAATKIKFRAFLYRNLITDPVPYVSDLYVRLQVQDDPQISLDVPRWVTSLSGNDAGMVPLLNVFNAYADAGYKLQQTSILLHVDSKRKFKVLSLNPNAPMGILTSWDMELRLIQPDEPQNSIP